LQPFAHIDDIGAAAWEPDSGYADPARTVDGLARRAAELGARILQWTPVRKILTTESRAVGVETSAGRIDAGAVAGAAARRGAADLPRDRRRAAGAAERHRHGAGHAPAVADRAARDLHRQRARHLLPARERDPYDRRRAVPGVGSRSRWTDGAGPRCA